MFVLVSRKIFVRIPLRGFVFVDLTYGVCVLFGVLSNILYLYKKMLMRGMVGWKRLYELIDEMIWNEEDEIE